jgi:hypothetical protein
MAATRFGNADRQSRPYQFTIGQLIIAGFTCIALIMLLELAKAAAQTTMNVRMDFEIPAPPLPKALHAFSAATGIEILADARRIAGRVSSPIMGTMEPREALEALLFGSDLVARQFGSETITLQTLPHSDERIVRGGQPYFGDIQRAVEQALCNDTRTLPGGYRLALKLWIDDSGTVRRFKRLDTTGNDNLDAALDAVMRNVRIGRAPPGRSPATDCIGDNASADIRINSLCAERAAATPRIGAVGEAVHG